jgi:hypothetical protein
VQHIHAPMCVQPQTHTHSHTYNEGDRRGMMKEKQERSNLERLGLGSTL